MIDASVSGERKGRVSLKVNLNAPEITQSAKIWLPYPVSSNEQLIEDINIEGNFINSAVYKEPESGVLYFLLSGIKPSRRKTGIRV